MLPFSLLLLFVFVYHFSLYEGKELLLVLYNRAWKQILLDKIARLRAFYNADGLRIFWLDNRSRSPSPIFVWFVVFCLSLRHFSHTAPFSTTIPSRESLISFPDLALLDTWPG